MDVTAQIANPMLTYDRSRIAQRELGVRSERIGRAQR